MSFEDPTQLIIQPNHSTADFWVTWKVIPGEYRLMGPTVGSLDEFLKFAADNGLEAIIPDMVQREMAAAGVWHSNCVEPGRAGAG